MFTGDLLPSNHAAYSLDPFALWTAFPPSMVGRYSHDYYGSSATSRRQQRTVRLPQARGLGGHRRDASHVHHRPVGRVGAQLYPGGLAARYRNTARDLDRPSEYRTGETVLNRYQDRATSTAHSRQFPGCCQVSGLLTLVRLLRLSALLPHPTRWRRAVARSSGAAPALHHTSGLGLPLSFTRPLRRSDVGPFIPPGHMAPRGAHASLATSRLAVVRWSRPGFFSPRSSSHVATPAGVLGLHEMQEPSRVRQVLGPLRF